MTTATAEDKDVSRKGILFELGLHHSAQTGEAAPQIGHSGCDPDLGLRRERDHLSKRSSTALNACPSAFPSMRIRAFPNLIWMVPVDLAEPIASAAPSVTLTGSRLLARAAPSTPRRCCLRQLKIRLALIPCCRAIRATDAPGSMACWTILSFSSRLRRCLTTSFTASDSSILTSQHRRVHEHDLLNLTAEYRR